MAETYFISYTGQDKKWADLISEVLEDQGQTVRYQAGDFRAGDSYLTKMDRYIEECDVFIAVLSQAYMESKWCREEWEQVLPLVVHGQRKRMVPVRVTDMSPSGPFTNRVFIDLYAHDEEKAERRLIEELFPEEPWRLKLALPINNLPERNPHFSGREDLLGEIHIQFRSGETGCIKQTIAGLGGVGKTQTATEYAWRHIRKYKDAVWLVNAETETSAFHDFLGFAKTTGSIPENTDGENELTQEQLAGCLRTWFAEHHSWLIILDNTVDRKVIAPYISSIQTGRLLFTTRDRVLRQSKSYSLEPFTPDEALQFMRKRLSENIDLIDGESAILSLIEKMSCFPLALEQAGAYMENTRRTCSEYLDLLDKRGTLETLAAKQSAPTNYHLTVTGTLSLSFDKLSESARQLFDLCAYMSPDGIPLAFFKRQRKRLPDPLREDLNDDFKQDDILMELLKYSLVKHEGDQLSLQRFVQEIGRDRIKDSETDWPGICLDAVTADIPAEDDYGYSRQREQFTEIAAHAAAIAGHAENTYPHDADKKKEVARLYNLLGIGCVALAQYEQALEWYQKALTIREEVSGKDHPDTAATYNNTGYSHSCLGDYPGALEWYYKALVIREAALGKEHPDTAATYNNIAFACSCRGDTAEALEWYQKALVIREAVLGKEHPDTAATYDNIAAAYYRQGDLLRAMEWYQKALAIREAVLGKEHPDTAATYNNMALVYHYQGDFPNALMLYQKAIAIREAVLGKESPYTAATYDNIAGLYHSQGDLTNALAWHLKAMAIAEKVLGTDHPDTATTYANVAGVYFSQSNYPLALEYYTKASVICEKVIGAESPYTAASYDNIARVRFAQGNHSGAMEWFQKALVIREKALGKDDPYTAASYNNIAGLYHSRGDHANALEWYLKASAIHEKVLSKDNPHIAAMYDNIAGVYFSLGDYRNALEWCHKSLVIREEVLGKEHPDTAISYNYIASVYNALGDHQNMLEWCLKSYRIFLIKLGAAHPNTKSVLYNMEAAYRNMNLYEPFEMCWKGYSGRSVNTRHMPHP